MCDNKKKCDMKGVTLGFIMNWNFAKKVRHEMCDPWFYMKSVWGRGMVELTDLTITTVYEYKFCSKKCDMKSVTLGFVWTEILLKKVWHEMCNPSFYMNRNFAQKSATWKVWPLVLGRGMAELTNQTTATLYEPKFCSKKCDMKSVTLGFGKRYGGHTIRERLFVMILGIFYEFRNFMNTCS